MIGIDQYGDVYRIRGQHPRKELMAQFNSTHADKMYIDTTTGTKHIGYIIHGHWITLYKRWERNA